MEKITAVKNERKSNKKHSKMGRGLDMENERENQEHVHVFEVDGRSAMRPIRNGEYISAKTNSPFLCFGASRVTIAFGLIHMLLLSIIAWKIEPAVIFSSQDTHQTATSESEEDPTVALLQTFGASSDGLFPLYWNSNDPEGPLLLLGIPTDSILDRTQLKDDSSPPTLIIIDVMFGRGSIKQGHQESLFHMPAIETDYNVFQFEYSPEGNYQIDFVRSLEYVRPAQKGTFKSAEKPSEDWTGWVTTLSVIAEKTCDKQDTLITCTPIVYVDATDLLVNRFYLISSPDEYDYDNRVAAVRVSNITGYVENVNIEAQFKFGSGTRSYNYDYVFGISKLPDEPMVARIAHDRIGYFTTAYQSIGLNGMFRGESQVDQVDRTVRIINRRRLDDKNSQLVYYVDPSVPLIWRKYIKKGVENWNVAFKEAGFTNAIRAVLPGDKDFPTDYQAGDIRYSSISWAFDPDETFALGPATVDPRSGEIINADIVFTNGWVASWIQGIDFDAKESSDRRRMERKVNNTSKSFKHSRSLRGGSCLHSRVFGMDQSHVPSEEFVDQFQLFVAWMKLKFPEKRFPTKHRKLGSCADEQHHLSEQFVGIVGQGITDVTMHEVGHTLGLRHNFKGSTYPSVANLNDPGYIEKNGLTSSVMDYLPLNFWAKFAEAANPDHIPRNEGDGIPEALTNYLFTPVVGIYDKVAIQYGYTKLTGPDAEDVEVMKECYFQPIEIGSSQLGKIVRTAPPFGTDEDDSTSRGPDPSNNLFDLSDDPLEYYSDQLQLVHRIRKVADGEMQDLDLERHTNLRWFEYGYIERVLLSRIRRAGLYAAKFIGGSRVNKEALPVQVVASAQQFRALELVLDVISGKAPDQTELFPGTDPLRAQWAAKRSGKCDGLQQYCYGVEVLNWNDRVFELQLELLNNLLSHERIGRIFHQEAVHHGKSNEKEFSVWELLQYVREALLGEQALKTQSQWPIAKEYLNWLAQQCVEDPDQPPKYQNAILCSYSSEQLKAVNETLVEQSATSNPFVQTLLRKIQVL